MNQTTETSNELQLALARLARSKELLAAAPSKDLQRIHSSDGWKILLRFYRLRNLLLPPKSLRRQCVRLLFGGVRGFAKGAIRAGSSAAPADEYAAWILENEPGEQELARQRSTRFAHHVKFSFVSPTYETQPRHLVDMIDSVRAQTYANWELCIADGASRSPTVLDILEKASCNDPRIKVSFLDHNGGIAGNTRAATELAGGDYVTFLDHDDTLAPFALHELAKAIDAEPDADMLYSDEDKIDDSGTQRSGPVVKPAWSPELLRTCNYITHLAVYRRDLLQQVGGVRFGFDGSQDYDLILRATEQAHKIVHIPKILYHWRAHSGSTSQDIGAKPYAVEAGRKALQEHLDRRGIAGIAIELDDCSPRYEIIPIAAANDRDSELFSVTKEIKNVFVKRLPTNEIPAEANS